MTALLPPSPSVEQFLCDASWLMPSSAAVDHACLELRALRRAWLVALAAAGLTESDARARGAHLASRELRREKSSGA